MRDRPNETAAEIATRIARAPAQEPLKRFYKAVTCEPDGDACHVLLDGRRLKTPAKRPQRLPGAGVAALVAAEWEAQGPHVLPATMPVTRLANLVIDRAEATRAAMADEIARYAATDLVCYRTTAPAGLAAAQAAAWDPPLDWAERAWGARLAVTEHALAIEQPAHALDAARAMAAELDDWRLTIAAFATNLTGSAVLGLMLASGALDAQAAFTAIRVEEDWQIRIWGQDEDDAAAAAARLADLRAACALASALPA